MGGWRLASQCDDLRALWCVGREHSVIAVGVDARGRDQRGQTGEGREAQLGAPIGLKA